MTTNTELNVVENAVAAQTQSDIPTTLRRIKDGEKFSPKTVFNGGRKVTCTYSFRPHENGPRYEKTTVFDFSNVSEEQLLALALSSARITVQSLLRNTSPHEMVNPKTLSNVDVLKDVIEASRPSGDPATVAQRALDRLSPEIRAALLQQYAPKDTASGEAATGVAEEPQVAEEQQGVAE